MLLSYVLAPKRVHGELADLIVGILDPELIWQQKWCSSTVAQLARHIYDSRDFSAMPVLADALQDTGCNDETLLSNLRKPFPFARGWRVLDEILGLRANLFGS
jgi:hypothetical protein